MSSIGVAANARNRSGCEATSRVDQHVEIGVGPVLGVHVDPHAYQRYSLNATPTGV
jgi:hypothetical protein